MMTRLQHGLRAAEIGERATDPPLLIKHENLDDKIYARLKRMIADGQLAPGQRILQEKLARGMGVSRRPACARRAFWARRG